MSVSSMISGRQFLHTGVAEVGKTKRLQVCHRRYNARDCGHGEIISPQIDPTKRVILNKVVEHIPWNLA